MREREDFSQCLVDGDEQSLVRARRIRREALLVSIILEAVLVAAMFLWPLVTQGLPPQPFLITPTPLYHGGGSNPAPHGAAAAPRPAQTSRLNTKYSVAARPADNSAHAQTFSAEDAPVIGSGFGAGAPLGVGTEGGGETNPGAIGARPISEPSKPKPERPRRMSEGVMEAALLNKVQPQYPAAAQRMHLTGTVRLQAIIGKDGRVRDVEVLSGHPLLVRAALAAVREWRYRPTELNHEIVEVQIEITMNFVLE